MIKESSLFEQCAEITKPKINLTNKNLNFICDVMFDSNYQLMRDSVRYALDRANKKNHQVLVKKLTVDLATIDRLISTQTEREEKNEGI